MLVYIKIDTYKNKLLDIVNNSGKVLNNELVETINKYLFNCRNHNGVQWYK